MQARKNPTASRPQVLAPNSEAGREGRPPSGVSSPEAKGRVLIVEDDVPLSTRTGIRCLMATGQTDAKTKERAAMVQPLGWLPKPYGNEEMVQAVADAMLCNRAS